MLQIALKAKYFFFSVQRVLNQLGGWVMSAIQDTVLKKFWCLPLFEHHHLVNFDSMIMCFCREKSAAFSGVDEFHSLFCSCNCLLQRILIIVVNFRYFKFFTCLICWKIFLTPIRFTSVINNQLSMYSVQQTYCQILFVDVSISIQMLQILKLKHVLEWSSSVILSYSLHHIGQSCRAGLTKMNVLARGNQKLCCY